jgi:spore germination cell wall hydrolase CwlJ-like protein
LRNRPQPNRTHASGYYSQDLRRPLRRRSKIEEYAPVAFGGLLLMAAFGFAGNYLGRTADAHGLTQASIIAVQAAPAMQADVSSKSDALARGSLLPEGQSFDLLNETRVLEAEVVDAVGKTDFVMEDPVGLESLEAPQAPQPAPLKSLNTKPEKKIAAKPARLKIEPAAVDLKEEVKKPAKKKVAAIAPVQLVKPAKIAKIDPAVEEEKTLTKREKQRAVAQRRIRLAEENCLARGIYFEARGESEMGQLAVAKVILNRVKSPDYPNSICGVVYQGSQRRNSCQFSFACDGHADEIRQPASWAQAKRVAHKAIEGDHALKNMGALNYHADYVKPRWSKTMRRLTKIGTHIFYR